MVKVKGKPVVKETDEPAYTQVEQRFLCPACEKASQLIDPEDKKRKFIFKQSELKYKKDFDKDAVFLEAMEREYTRSSVKPIIHVEQEMPLSDVTTNAEFICGANKEIVNNDETFSPWVKKIHDYLVRNNKALLVTFGENGRMRAGFIIATPKKLALLELYAYDQIREPVQLNLEGIENSILNKLKAISENTSIVQYDRFIEEIKSGKEIVIEKKEEKVVPVLEATFLDA